MEEFFLVLVICIIALSLFLAYKNRGKFEFVLVKRTIYFLLISLMSLFFSGLFVYFTFTRFIKTGVCGADNTCNPKFNINPIFMIIALIFFIIALTFTFLALKKKDVKQIKQQ